MIPYRKKNLNFFKKKKFLTSLKKKKHQKPQALFLLEVRKTLAFHWFNYMSFSALFSCSYSDELSE